ncbi:MAG: hypothetical protein QNJ47_25950 [Nostocaceae cyanobacterium]|nr:hypothetical protein [Nostocaceae cyanobacterium]
MKLKLLSLTLFSLSAVSPLFIPSLTPSAMATGCVAASVGPQVSVRGSKTPAEQNNTVNQNIEEGCLGNSAVCTGAQVFDGPGSVVQNRKCSQTLKGNPNNNLPDVGNVEFNTNPKFDVYNPAKDQGYLNKFINR